MCQLYKMFPLFKNWKIAFLFVSLCSDTLSLYIQTTESVNDKVQHEEELQNKIAPVKKTVYEYAKAVDHDTKLKKEGEFIGRLEELGREAIKADKILKEYGRLEEKRDAIQDNALKLFIIPYFCQKFELYGDSWDPHTQTMDIENFDPDDINGTSLVNRELDEQTRASYRAQAKKWNRILSGSISPLAICFKAALQTKFPQTPLPILVKDLGLAIALMNNAKHGVIANDVKLRELMQSADAAVLALSQWSSFNDPVMLDVIHVFEAITTNRKWKPR